MPMYVAYITHVMNTSEASLQIGMPYQARGDPDRRPCACRGRRMGKDPCTIPIHVTYGDTTRGPGANSSSVYRVNGLWLWSGVPGWDWQCLLTVQAAPFPTKTAPSLASPALPPTPSGPIHLQETASTPEHFSSRCRIRSHSACAMPFGPVAVKNIDVSINYNPESQSASDRARGARPSGGRPRRDDQSGDQLPAPMANRYRRKPWQ